MYRLIKILISVMMLTLSACMAHGAVGSEGLPSLTDEQDEAAETKSYLASMLNNIDGYIAQSDKGRNLSDMTIGLYVSSLLGQLSGFDAPLANRLHQGGRLIDGYLTDVFQFHAQQEIDEISAMPQPGNVLARKTAAAALECLRHIPNGKNPPADQKQDREDMIKALMDLKQTLGALIASLP